MITKKRHLRETDKIINEVVTSSLLTQGFTGPKDSNENLIWLSIRESPLLKVLFQYFRDQIFNPLMVTNVLNFI